MFTVFLRSWPRFDGLDYKRWNVIRKLPDRFSTINSRLFPQCKCCPNDVGTIQDTMPDISVAYKLHLECGRLINLYDWLQVFLLCLVGRRVRGMVSWRVVVNG